MPVAVTPSAPMGAADPDLDDLSGLSAEELEGDESGDDSEGSKEWVVNEPRKPRKISEKKRADLFVFNQWVEENAETLQSRKREDGSVDDHSLAWLVKDIEGQRIIDSPRDYQVELFERAKEQNTIAVLDTGSGKTLIAVLLLRWVIEQELEDRAMGLPKRISFFLVDKVALVWQQHNVLSCNLDQPVEKFSGDMVDNAWNKAHWEKQFDDNMVIVCTAEILNKCLQHAYIRMDQINLLVFDEAHHTKKNHPYARIIKDFYAPRREEADGEAVHNDIRQPRILGMTASPVDAQVDVRKAALELEGLLHSKIATAADPAFLQQTVCKPKKEDLVTYDRLQAPWETTIYQSLREVLGEHELFRKPLTFAKEATSHLGPWCADRFWKLYFREDDLAKLEAKTERNSLGSYAFNDEVDHQVAQVRDARQIVENYPLLAPIPDNNFLSSKVVALYGILHDHFSPGPDSSTESYGGNAKCIVFVHQRYTAVLLTDLFKQSSIAIPNLRVGVLVGAGTWEAGYDKISMREQIVTITKFRKGELNCLFATSIAEEGLDIPDCNLIVRFDLYRTLIQYIQSRGRARHENSTFIHMVEKNNSEHRRLVVQSASNERALRKFCEAMPEDRRLTGNDFNMDYHLRKEQGHTSYRVKGTGAKLTYKQSLSILANFVASLPRPAETVLVPDYVVSAAPGGFQCEVILPAVSPIRNAVGDLHRSKAVAKCSAAFKMCLQLHKAKFLNEHLQPVFTKQLPAMRNARLAISSKKRSEYSMRVKPELWSKLGEPTLLYAMALVLADPSALGRPSRPLLLMTRRPLPQIGTFPLFFGHNQSSMVKCMPLPSSLELAEGDADLFAAFTLRIFQDVFSKQYDAAAAELPYFVLPTLDTHDQDFASVKDIALAIDWRALYFVKRNEMVEYRGGEDDDFFQNKYVTDPFDGSRKFFLSRRRHDLQPTDPVPEDVVAPGHRSWKVDAIPHDIINYSVSLWSKARSNAIWKEKQPVVEAEVLSIRRNLLDDRDMEHAGSKQCFIILEPLKISSLPADVVAMAYNFPAIIHRIESNLVAVDACNQLELSVRTDLALEALTKDSDNTGEHDAEQINFQGGMGNNYERLEFLGDTFLKMATTISIYTLLPEKGEFEYHVHRMCLVCNLNLFNNALEVNLQEYVRSMSFDRSSWYPQGLKLIKGKRPKVRNNHVLADKSIADVCEALIGAAYLTGRKQGGGFDLAVQAVTTMVKDKKHRMQKYSDYYAAYKPTDWQLAPATHLQLDMAKQMQEKMGYEFKHPRILRCAFMHPSYPARSFEKLPTYQRLEFLGDALLDWACVVYLFDNFPHADPQWLTEHKMAMVSNQFLGCLAVSLGFHRHLVAFNGQVQKEIVRYVTELDEALTEAKEAAVASGMKEEDYARDFWITVSHPPKCLPDVMEAYIGAVFVDSKYDYYQVQAFFDRHVKPYFADMGQYDAFAGKHPVTHLGRMLHQDFRCNAWRVLVREIGGEVGGEGSSTTESAVGPVQVVAAVVIHGQTFAHAVSASGRYAKIAAAKKAIRQLEGLMSPDDFRKKFTCACTFHGEGEADSGGIDVSTMAALHGTAI